MGVYLNPDNRLFAEATASEIYVDKTELIELTNRVLGTLQKFVCISRPRRFGKSMAANMLAAYYGRGCDSRALFESYKIAKCESYEKHLNQYNVIALNMQNFLSVVNSVEELITFIQAVVLEELRECYADKIPTQERFLSMALDKLYSRTGEGFVFIIDEWDCILREEFKNAVEGSNWTEVIDAIKQSEQLLQATWNQDAETVAGMIDSVHMENTSILTYNDENSLSCVISLAYYNAINEYTKIRELPTGKGFADIVYLPIKHSDKPAMIVELKYDKSAEGAIAQIKEKKYVESLKEYQGNLLLVGINYDKETKKHCCVIEKYEKNL